MIQIWPVIIDLCWRRKKVARLQSLLSSHSTSLLRFYSPYLLLFTISSPQICLSFLLQLFTSPFPPALISLFDPLWDTPALPAGSVRISVICVRADKPACCSSCAVAWGWRQWHQFAPRTTCPSVKTNDKDNLFWSLWTNKQWKDYYAHHRIQTPFQRETRKANNCSFGDYCSVSEILQHLLCFYKTKSTSLVKVFDCTPLYRVFGPLIYNNQPVKQPWFSELPLVLSCQEQNYFII